MQPVSPVFPGRDVEEIVFAKDQPEYIPLPAVSRDGIIHTRWRLTLRERIRVLFRGTIYHSHMTFNRPPFPIKLSTEEPEL